MEGVHYCGGMPSVLWGMTAVHVGDNSSTCGVIASALWDTFRTVQVVQYSGDKISTVEESFSLVEGIQYIGGYHQYSGCTFSTVGDNISTVEVSQYNGDKTWNIKNFERISKSFPEAYFASKSDRPHRRPQVLTTAGIVKDLGHKNLVLGKILLWTYERLGFWKYSVKFFGNCGRICEQFMVQGQSRSTAVLRSIQDLLRMNSNLVGIQSE